MEIKAETKKQTEIQLDEPARPGPGQHEGGHNSIERDGGGQPDRVVSSPANAWVKTKTTSEVTVADDRFPDQAPITGSAGKKAKDDPFLGGEPEQVKVVSERIEKAYIKVGDRYHYEHRPDLEAFHDKGNSLETKSEGAQVAKDLVAIADVRAWGRLRVQGTEDFKRQVWLEASMRGIEVAGFKPTEADKALLIKQQRDVSPAEAAQEAAGKAKDVPAASAKGAAVSAAVEAEKAATPEQKAEALRSMDRKAAVRRHPELVNAYALLRAAELVAERRISGKDGQQAFVESVKDTLANKIERGEQLPTVRYNERRQERVADSELSR